MEGKSGIWKHNFSSIIENTGRNLFDLWNLKYATMNSEVTDERY